MSFHPAHLTLCMVLLAACDAPSTETDPTRVPVLALSATPTLEIGVVEGGDDYVFQEVASVIRLSSGNVVAADVGASEIAAYDPSGTFLRRWGGRGEGPGEFRNLVRLYPSGPDSLMALDGWTSRVSMFDTAGVFSHQVATSELTSDTLFSMDVWLYGRFWVDGALAERARAPVRATLDRLPVPGPGSGPDPGYRFVRVEPDGDLWIREPGVDPDGNRSWTIVDPAGGPEAILRIPARFDPHSLGDREVLGRWRGDRDVHFVRAYDVADTGARGPLPTWLTSVEPRAPLEAPDQDAFMDQIRTAFRGMARAQEIHYATAMTYTARMDSLDWTRPEEVVVDVINAGPRGWAAVFTHPGLDRICALGYGYAVPPGWAPGGVLCGPPAATSGRSEG